MSATPTQEQRHNHRGACEVTKQELGEGIGSKLARECLRREFDGELAGSSESFLRNLKTVSRDNLIATFLKCSICGQFTMPVEQSVQLAAYAKTVNEWEEFLVGFQRKFGPCCHNMGEPS